MDSRCAIWQAGGEAIARGDSPAPFSKSISPLSNKETGNNEDIDSRMNERSQEGREDLKRGKKKKKKKRESEQPGASLQGKEEDLSDQPRASLQRKNIKVSEEIGDDIDDADWIAAYEGEDRKITGQILKDAEGSSSGGENVPAPQEANENFEVRKHVVASRPMLPTKAEIESHYPLHLQYRSWCKHCVAGKARAKQHAKKEEPREIL